MTAAIADALGPAVEAGTLSGFVVLLARDDDVDVTVLGDQALGGDPMRQDSIFRIASLTKPITAVATLILVAEGLLDLDDPVAEFLPELATPRVLRNLNGPLDDTVAVSRPITVRDLLRSTNGHGFPSDFSAPIVATLMQRLHQGEPRPQAFPALDDWMAALGATPLLHQPGEGFTYNTAFDILSVLVARVGGLPFADHLDARLFGPLGMVDTGFSYDVDQADRVSSSYRRSEDGGEDENGRLELVDGPDGQWSTEPAFASGAGGLVSTAADLLAFQRMLLAGGGDVLPSELVSQIMADQLDDAIRATDTVFLDGQSWGFGVGVDIAKVHPWNIVGRYGWVGGTGTSAYAVPSDGASRSCSRRSNWPARPTLPPSKRSGRPLLLISVTTVDPPENPPDVQVRVAASVAPT